MEVMLRDELEAAPESARGEARSSSCSAMGRKDKACEQ